MRLMQIKMDATMNNQKLANVLLLIYNYFNNEIISSSESSDSENEDEDIILNLELEILYAKLFVNETRGEVFVEKLTNYVERVIPDYSRIVFKEHFR